MLDIVFGDSACGSLKAAQHYGEGEYHWSGRVFAGDSDGEKPTPEEIEKVRREFEEKERAEWEKGVPMGGHAGDIFGFNFVLSVGDISEDEPGVLRQRALEWLWSIYPGDMGGEVARATLKPVVANYSEPMYERISAGEPLRIWYSNQPDEMCGLHWFMAQLVRLEMPCENISVVRLTDWEVDGNGALIGSCGWGGVKPGDWHRYLDLQEKVTPELCKGLANHWQQLQRENAPLRAVLNGQLLSVAETIYDEFILREIEAEGEVFHEAMIIGRVLGKYNLGISDAWVALRIEKMIHEGFLEPATEALKDSPIYHRKLRKYIKG